MGNPGLTREEVQDAFDAIAAHKTQQAAADALGISRGALQNRLNAPKRGFLGTDPVIPGFRISQTTTTPNGGKFVQQKPDHGAPFEVPEGHNVKGVSALVDAHGNTIQQWVKTHSERSPEELADIIKAAFENWTAPNIVAPEHGDTDADTLTTYPIADAHLGLKAVADESGADFDLSIAVDRFRETTARLFERSPNSDTGLIIQLGDWTHTDDDLALTPTSKNSLQVSDRMLDITKAGVRIMVDYIYHALRKHRRVVVKILKGNHDLNAWLALYMALCEHFRDNERVTIDGGAADYWFFRWGKTLIGAHHGHRLKPEQMAGAMAMECREDWGETLYRIFLHGHLHHRRVIEVLGVSVECMRTIAEVDQHHSGKYGSGKSLVSITFHKEHGEDGRAQINLPPMSRRAARA